MFPCPAATLESPAPSGPERQQEPGHGQQDASTPRKQHTQYRRFTESEATQIDPGRILTDALYQLQIARDFGMDVLNTLAEKARQQQGRFQAPRNNFCCQLASSHNRCAYYPQCDFLTCNYTLIL